MGLGAVVVVVFCEKSGICILGPQSFSEKERKNNAKILPGHLPSKIPLKTICP
jgi:hypothetical protein